MSQLDDFIAKHCPNGVEFRELSKVIHRTTNIKWSDVDGEEFRYIDLTSVDRITHAIVETQIISSENAPSRAQQVVREGDVIFGTTRPMLKRYTVISADYDGDICSTGYCVLRPNTEMVLPNFVFHLLGTETFYTHVEANERGASYPAISDSAVKAFCIPVPPLEVQREIVKVLDTFTKLEAELEAELEARRRQYKYYRDALLTFDEHAMSASKQASKQAISIRWTTLGDIATYSNSRTPWYGLDANSYVGVDNLLADMRGKTQSSYVPTVGTSIGYEIGDILIGNIRPYLKKIWLADSNGGTNQDVLVVRLRGDAAESIKPRYLYHLLASEHFFAYNMQNAKGAKMPRGDKDAVMRYEIPIPPPSEQTHIVAILDKFDTLVNDLSTGLPAEIKARRQQYEHYRDRLLTFKEAA